MNEIEQLRLHLERKKGQRDQLLDEINGFSDKLSELKKDISAHEEALFIFQTVAQNTQSELQFHISEIVSLALSSIFDDPYIFDLDFVIRRGKTEAVITFIKNGKHIKPLNASGGGAVDVASFGLRISLWSLQQPRSDNTIILDEPFKALDPSKHEKASLLLKELSNKLGLQFIIVSHSKDLKSNADRVFEVAQVNGISEVRMV